MITLILGGSGSGKSQFAEKYCMERSEGEEMLYIATMQVYGEEGRRKVERHRSMRAGKNFRTLECPRDLEACIKAEKKVIARNEVTKQSRDRLLRCVWNDGISTVLLECMSNLTANEMFTPNGKDSRTAVIERVLQGIRSLDRNFRRVVIVSNNIFEDGILYDPESRDYMEALGEINLALAEMAEEVIELQAGQPLYWKRREEKN